MLPGVGHRPGRGALALPPTHTRSLPLRNIVYIVGAVAIVVIILSLAGIV